MPITVPLKEIVDAIQMSSDEVDSHLDPDTGEIFVVSYDDKRALNAEDEDFDLESLPRWQQEYMPRLREAYNSGRLIALPDKHDIHEWAIMEEFSVAQPTERVRRELDDAIHGTGAFRAFKSAIRRLRIDDRWYAFRDNALEEIAREWIEEHNLTYK